MDTLHVILLALIQGLTEFLPISSSGHLILPKEVLGWPDQGLAFDVAVHFGTLAAVVLYFRGDIVVLCRAWLVSLGARFATDRAEQQKDAQLSWMIIVATVPACLAGLFFSHFIETHLRSMLVIAITTLAFGVLLGLSDMKRHRSKSLCDIGILAALAIGSAQALALIPGTSRSGITISVALLMGFSREDAARFSFLLSIPIILLSACYKSFDLAGVAGVDWQAIIVGVLVSALSAYICIHYFLSFISRLGMMPFVVYRMLLGMFLFYLVLR